MPIFTPTGTQMIVETTSRTTTLPKVTNPSAMSDGKCEKPRCAFKYRTALTATNPNAPTMTAQKMTSPRRRRRTSW